jgi:D-xylose transport system substrate-binding protein
MWHDAPGGSLTTEGLSKQVTEVIMGADVQFQGGQIRTFKRFIVRKGMFSGALFVLLSLTHCTKKSSPSAENSATPHKLKLGFVLATMNEERYAKDLKYFSDFAALQGADVEFASADNKVDIQTSKVETLLSKKVDALVIQPVNGEAAGSFVDMAKRDGVPVIAYDRIIRNADIDLYVTQDSFEVGVLQAKAAVEATKGKGNYIILMGEAGHSVADEITRGNLSVLEKYPDIHLVVKQNHPGWSTALALSTVENALTKNKNNIQAILANNDGMALGATQALEEQKLAGKVFLAGADCDLAAVKDILNGKQTMTVLKGIKPLAEAAVLAAVQLGRKETPKFDTKMNNGKKEVLVVNTPVFKVTKDNVQEQVVDYGFHPAEAVFGKNKAGE